MPTTKADSLAAAAVLIVLCVSPSSAAASEAGTPLANIPNVLVISYDVTGRDAQAIRRSINAARPADPNDGMRVDGLSTWNFRWRWHQDGQGRCTAAPDDITFSATVRVPRLSDDKASPEVREQFSRYLQSLLEHEDGHVRYAWEHRGDIVAAINSGTCSTASAAAQTALKAIADHDIIYDKATRHGTTTVLPFG